MVKKAAFVKFTVDLLAPGAIITRTMTNYYARWDAFHERRCLWPALPMAELFDIAEDGSKALQDLAHIRVSTMMDGHSGVFDGELDSLLTINHVHEVFDMPRIIGVALAISHPYAINKTRAGWVELYDVGDDKAEFIRMISIEEIRKLKTEAPTE